MIFADLVLFIAKKGPSSGGRLRSTVQRTVGAWLYDVGMQYNRSTPDIYAGTRNIVSFDKWGLGSSSLFVRNILGGLAAKGCVIVRVNLTSDKTQLCVLQRNTCAKNPKFLGGLDLFLLE